MGIFDESDDPLVETLKDTACGMMGVPRPMVLGILDQDKSPPRREAPQAPPPPAPKLKQAYHSTNSYVSTTIYRTPHKLRAGRNDGGRD